MSVPAWALPFGDFSDVAAAEESTPFNAAPAAQEEDDDLMAAEGADFLLRFNDGAEDRIMNMRLNEEGVVILARSTSAPKQNKKKKGGRLAGPETKCSGAGGASFYANKFDGRKTASGQIFRQNKLTAAHRSLPWGTRVKVTNQKTGKSVIVTINDNGPFHKKRVIDLSRSAAEKLGLIRAGHGQITFTCVS